MIGMVLIVVVALAVIAVFSEDDEPGADLPRHLEPESHLDDLLE